jgi:hypothetical protein
MSVSESDGGPLNRVWENKYTARRAEGVYKAEVPRESNDQAIFPNGITLLDYLEQDDIVGLTTAFLNVHRDCLEAPAEFNDAALRSFLVAASSQDLKSSTKPAGPPHCTILMDDRRDPGVGPWAIRRWDGPEGYTDYPPEGCDIWPEQQKDLSLLELVSRPKENVSCTALFFHMPCSPCNNSGMRREQRSVQCRVAKMLGEKSLTVAVTFPTLPHPAWLRWWAQLRIVLSRTSESSSPIS